MKSWRFKTVERGDAQYAVTSGRVEGAEVQYDNVRAYRSNTLQAFESIQIRLVRYKTLRHAHAAFVAAKRSYPLSPWGRLGEESARRIEPPPVDANGRLVTTVWRSGPVLAISYFTGADGALRERILRAQQRNLR